MSAPEFNQDVSAAKPTDEHSLLERLSMDDGIDFEPEAVALDLQVPEL